MSASSGGGRHGRADDAADDALRPGPRGGMDLAGRDVPYLVTRHAIEDLTGSRGLSADELIDVCEEHAAYFASVAARKLVWGVVDPDVRAVVMTLDVTATD